MSESEITTQIKLLKTELQGLLKLEKQQVAHLIQIDQVERKNFRETVLGDNIKVLSELKRNRRVSKLVILLGLAFAGYWMGTIPQEDLAKALKLFIPFI